MIPRYNKSMKRDVRGSSAKLFASAEKVPLELLDCWPPLCQGSSRRFVTIIRISAARRSPCFLYASECSGRIPHPYWVIVSRSSEFEKGDASTCLQLHDHRHREHLQFQTAWRREEQKFNGFSTITGHEYKYLRDTIQIYRQKLLIHYSPLCNSNIPAHRIQIGEHVHRRRSRS